METKGFIIPCPTKLGWGVMASPRMSVRPSVRISFPEQISETHGGDFFHFVQTLSHHLQGVDVPFGVYEI